MTQEVYHVFGVAHGHNANNHRIVLNWLNGNLSNKTMQEALGLSESERE